MYIQDVIGDLREKYLDLVRRIDALRLDVHIVQSKVDMMVSRETTRHLEAPDGNGTASLFDAIRKEAQTEADLGSDAPDPRPARKRGNRRTDASL